MEEDTEEIVPEEEQPDTSLQTAVNTIPDIWGAVGQNTYSPYTKKQLANIRKSRAIMNTSHGMYAGVPMICQADKCPFRATCWIPDAELAPGERCPIEIGTILEQYENYCRVLEVGPADKVDQGLVKQLIDIEVMMMRADNKMAANPDVLREVVDAINQRTGDVYHKTEVDPLFTLKADLRREHHRILNQLQATRKDKKDTLLGRQDPSSMAAALIQRVKSMQRENVIVDAEFVEEPSPTQDEVK